jgi:hypothetical protein
VRRLELDVAVDRPQQQVAFASKRGVKARSAKAGGTARIVERRRFVTLAPKGLHRAVERAIQVEFAGTGHPGQFRIPSTNARKASPISSGESSWRWCNPLTVTSR